MSKYKMPYGQYKICQKMTKNEFGRWLETFAEEMANQGYEQACKDIPDGSIVLNPEENLIVNWEEEEFYNMLLTVKGIGPSLANKIIDKIYEYYDNASK